MARRTASAQLRKALTIEEYLDLPMMVAPFRRDDCCLVSDGGAAVVVMSAERARQLKVRAPVAILGFGQGHTAWDVTQRPDLTTTMATVSAATAYKMAGLGPKDIDVAQIYDCFTITALMTLERLRLLQEGRGRPLREGGRIEIGGELPMNTAGGLLSETGMPGMQMVSRGFGRCAARPICRCRRRAPALSATRGESCTPTQRSFWRSHDRR